MSSHPMEDLPVAQLTSPQKPEASHSQDPLVGLPNCVLVATEQLIGDLLEAAEAEINLDDWDVVAAELDIAFEGARVGWLITIGDLKTRTILGSTTVFEPTSATGRAA